MNYEQLKQEILKKRTVDFMTIEDLVSSIVNWNPNWDDEKYFEHAYLKKEHRYFFYYSSCMTDHVVFVNDIFVCDYGRLDLFRYFVERYKDKKDSDGHLHNDELAILQLVSDERILVVNLPEE